MNTLQNEFQTSIVSQLQKQLGIANVMATPRLQKVVVSMGVKDALADKKNIQLGIETMTQITGQKPKVTKAKQSIAGFKLRAGDQIGLKVTMRGKRMYDFVEKLVTVILPRLRDFHGISKKHFDGHGNYSLGFREYTVFPEIDLGKIERVQGLQVTITTTAGDDVKGHALLEKLGMPFVKG